MNDEKVIANLVETFRSFLNGQSNLTFDSTVRDSIESPALRELFDLVEYSFSKYNNGIQVVKSISEGNLDLDIPITEPILEPVKTLQTKLKQLFWQTQQIVAGDYDQHIDFIGDFSSSFNQLIQSLKSKQELEQKIAERQKKIQLIADNINDVIWTYDIASRKYSYVSPSIYRMLGIRAEEIMNESFENIMTPESVQKTLQNYHFIIQSKLTSHHLCDVYQFIRKDGQLIDVEICNSVIFDKNNQPIELLGISRDITERKKTELALKESEDKYRLITENSSDVIWTIDIATQKFTFISPSVFYLRGLTVEEAMKETLEESLAPESAQKVKQNIDSIFRKIKNKEPIKNSYYEIQQQCKDGSYIDLKINTNTIYDQNGQPKEIAGITRDITERKKAEKALKESEEKYRLITENSQDVIWIIDVKKLKYNYISPSVERFMGYKPEEILSLPLTKILPPETYQETLNRLHKKLNNHSDQDLNILQTYQILSKDGKIIDAEATINYIRDKNGQVVEILGASRDISQRIQAEKALKESEEKYRLITDNSVDTIWTVDIATQKITFISPSVVNLTGYKAEEVKENGFKLLLLPESNKKGIRVFSFLIKRLKEQQPIPRWKGLFQIRRKDGQISYIESSTNIIYDEKGEAKEIVGVSRDITKRKKIEQAIKEKEEKYRLITENTLDVIWKIDVKKLMYSYMSPSVKKIAGFTPQEVLKIPLSEALLPDSYQRVLQLIHERNTLPPEKELYICERFQIYSKDRRIIDIEATANFVRNRNGEVAEIIGVSRDISERIKIENALIKSEAKLTELLALQSVKNKQLSKQLQYIFNNANNAIAFFDIEGDAICFSSCNEQWANKIGFKPKDLENFDIAGLKDQETVNLYRRVILKTLEIKQPIEEFVKWHNYFLHVISIPIVNELTGEISSCGSLVYDITEKIETNQKLKETEERFISVFNNSKDAIVLLNMQLEIVDVNESFYQLHGSKDYYKQDILNSYFPKEYHKFVNKLMVDLKTGSSIPSFDCEVIKHNGTTVNVEISTSAITYRNEPMLLCTIRDISSKKEMERTLNNVSTQIETRERKRLAADLHDNVGPLLSSMNMYLSVLSRKKDLLPYSDTLNDIKRILKDTISSVREISNNLSPHVLTNFGLTAALDQFFETKKKLINIQINNTIENMRFPEFKEIMLYNIIIEAYNNSLKHAEADLIKLEIYHENNAIHFTYSDNGIGFDWEEKMKNTNHHLGLFSIINRVKILDGNFDIETSPGNGFLLRIIFPTNTK